MALSISQKQKLIHHFKVELKRKNNIQKELKDNKNSEFNVDNILLELWD
jgi:hypothetical protein